MKRFHSCRQTGVATPRGSRLRRDAEICTHFTDNSAALQPLPRRNSVKVVEKGRWGRGEKREEEGKKSGRQREREREGEEIGKKRKEERKEEKKDRTRATMTFCRLVNLAKRKDGEDGLDRNL